LALNYKHGLAALIIGLSFGGCSALGHLTDGNALNHAAIAQKYSDCVSEDCLTQALQVLDTPSNAQSLELAYVENKLANRYTDFKRFSEAESLYGKALKIRLAKLGEINSKVANVYANLGKVAEELGHHREAQRYLSKAVEIHQKLGLGANKDQALALITLGEFYCHNGNKSEGEKLLTSALDMYEELGVPDLANLYHNTAGTFLADKSYPLAEKYYSRALQLRIDDQGANHPDVALELGQLGYTDELQKKYAQAYDKYAQALKINQQVAETGEPQLGYSSNLFSLSRLSPKVGKPQDEPPLFKAAIEESWHLAPYDEQNVSGNLYRQISEYLKNQDLAHAGQVSDELIKLFDASHDKAQLIDDMYGVSYLYYEKKQWAQTEKFCQKLSAYFESNQTEYVLNYPDVLTLLAEVAEQKQDYKSAIALLEKAYALRVKQQGKENEQAAVALSKLALDYLRLNDLQKARSLYDQIIPYYQKRLNSALSEQLEQQGLAFSQAKEYGKAQVCYEKALQLREALYGTSNAVTAPAHWGLAYSLGKQGKLALAEPHYQVAFSIYQKSNPALAQTITKEFSKLRVRG